MEEGTQIERECLREGEGVDQEKLGARRDCVGGGGERRRCGKEAAREWRGRGAGVRVLRATGSVRMVKQCVSGGGAELWRRRRCVRAAAHRRTAGGAVERRRGVRRRQRFQIWEEGVVRLTRGARRQVK